MPLEAPVMTATLPATIPVSLSAMDWQGWLTFGFVATAMLTAILVGAQLARQTRMDLPTMLGTLVTSDLDKARLPGILIHLFNGQVFALFYASAFALIGHSGVLLGAAFG